MSTAVLYKPYRKVRRLDLKVGFSCINDCRFCVVVDKRKFPDKTTEQIKKELEDAYGDGLREIVFTGGEFTIRDDVFEIVKFAKNLGFLNIQAQTNGRRFSSLEFCKKILLAGMTTFCPSLHGHNAQIHDYLTRCQGSFRQTVLGIYNIKKLTQGRVKIRTNTVINKYNFKFLPQIAELLIKLGVNQYQFAFIHALSKDRDRFRDLVPRKSEVVPYLIKGLELGIKRGLIVMAEAMPLCLMRGYEKYASEFYIPPTEVKERGLTIKNFEEVRIREAKLKFSQCPVCKYNTVCEGPWKEYVDYYGDEEFKPVMGKG